MASREITDPQLVPFLTENYEKEKWLRLYWVRGHTKQLERATTLDREPTHYRSSDIRKQLITDCMPSLAKGAVESTANKKKAPLKDICLVKINDSTKERDPVMKPMKDEIREVLYKRKKCEYLKLRYETPPDKKYNYVECTSWMYGWGFDESALKLHGPVHGKIFHLQRMKGVGPQPDPIHYQQVTDSYEICT